MSLSPSELWNTWRTSPEIQEFAEAWMTTPEGDWTEDNERLARLIHSDPDRALSIIFAIMQMTHEQPILYGWRLAGCDAQAFVAQD